MKRITAIVSTLLVIAPLCASAQPYHDYKNYKDEVMPTAPLCTWTGFYVGANLGAIWPAFSNTVVINGPLHDATGFNDNNSSYRSPSFVGGLQAGYDVQYQQMVLGLEGDWDGMNINASHTLARNFNPLSEFAPGDTFKFRSHWQASIRARVGVAMESWLVYLTGGASFINLRSEANFVSTTFAGVTSPAVSGSGTKTLIGWTAGAGTEFQITNNWSVAAEYRYARYGSRENNQDVGLVNLPRHGLTRATRADVWMYTSEVLAKVNYKFA